jgi:molybdate transport system substrate-binding protein
LLKRLVLVAASLFLPACAAAPVETRVAAAVSLQSALQEVAQAFEAHYEGRRVALSFAGSGVLLAQIEQGAPFDVVVLAGEDEMDRLARGGRIEPHTRIVVASNRLVVAVPRGSPLPASLSDLLGTEFERIAIGAPAAVPVGRYAREALEHAGLWEALRPRLMYAEHAAQVRTYLDRGEADAGLVYASDLLADPAIQEAFPIDPASHTPILYPAALLREARDPEGGALFLDMLGGALGEVVLRRHGFLPRPEAASPTSAGEAGRAAPGGSP